MSITRCKHCGHEHDWRWTEAFEKFGFDDGDGLVMTETVVNVLAAAGYAVSSFMWGMHNTIISSIRRGRTELIPKGTKVGYDDPRQYLPTEIIALLDERFDRNEEVQP